MLDLELFVGFPIQDSLQERLKKIPPNVFSLLVGDNPDYLKEWVGAEGHFIGKKVGKEIDLETLKLVEANIYSLLTRLMPDYPLKDTPLILFSIASQNP